MNTQSNKLFSILLLVAGILMVGFSAGRWLAPLAAWIGPVLFMRFMRDQKAGRGILLIVIAYSLAFQIAFGRMWIYMGGIGMAIALSVLYGILWGLGYLADRLLGPRLHGFSSTLVYPFTAGTIELINNYTNPIGNWGATGYTQYGNMPVMQLSSVTGMVGITFLMGWFASTLNWAWENRGSRREAFRGLSIFGAVFALVFIYGFVRLNFSPLSETGDTIRIAGITNTSQLTLYEDAGGYAAWREDPASPLASQAVLDRWESYFADTVREAEAGAQLVLWNEIAGLTSDADLPALTASAQEIAQQNSIYLAIPLAVFYPAKAEKLYENTMLLIDPSGAIILEHDKFGGALIEYTRVPGEKILDYVDTPLSMIAGVVCWDMDYPNVIQEAGQKGAGLMLAPGSDSISMEPIHTYMAVFRGIENGMSVVRQAEYGLSIAVDPYGRVLAQTDFFGATDRTLVAQVPVKHVATVYTLFGHYFEWVCLAGFLVLAARALVTRRQTS
jgi:apolipoprotein N-acyltransferase